jgi:hypothetical protein
MVDIERSDGLESGTNMDFQRRWWALERALHVLITLLLLAGAAGLFGRGPLSTTAAGERGGPLWAEYERFARFRTPTMLTVHLGPQLLHGGRVAMRITGPINERLPISRIVPQPVAASPIADGQLLTFPIASPADSVSIHLALEPGRVGPSHGTVSVEGAAPLPVSQFVYP